jgi:hypothetical protein
MPINDARFKKSNRDAVAVLMEFLHPNFHVAYTLDELQEVLADKGIEVSDDALESLLFSLEYGGRIISKKVDKETYYQYRKVLGFMPLKRFK